MKQRIQSIKPTANGQPRPGWVRRYSLFFVLALAYVIIMIVLPDLGWTAITMTGQSVVEMLLVLR